MSSNVQESISAKYCLRFGQTAVEMGFITESQLKEALCCQIEENLSDQGHRLLGTILFDMDWMTAVQIEKVVNALLKSMREEEGKQGSAQTQKK